MEDSRFIQLFIGSNFSFVTNGAGNSDPIISSSSPSMSWNLKSPSIHPLKGLSFAPSGTLIVIFQSKGRIKGLKESVDGFKGVTQIAFTSVFTILPPADIL